MTSQLISTGLEWPDSQLHRPDSQKYVLCGAGAVLCAHNICIIEKSTTTDEDGWPAEPATVISRLVLVFLFY